MRELCEGVGYSCVRVRRSGRGEAGGRGAGDRIERGVGSVREGRSAPEPPAPNSEEDLQLPSTDELIHDLSKQIESMHLHTKSTLDQIKQKLSKSALPSNSKRKDSKSELFLCQ